MNYLFINTVLTNCPSFAVFDAKGKISAAGKHIPMVENLVAGLIEFLQKNKIDSAALSGVLVVAGPGSFSSSRAGVVLANAFSFLQKTPVVGVAADETARPEDLIAQNIKKLIAAKQGTRAEVFYKYPPHITAK
jgi:tRNA A37 threonylcarbamoyladenosine modification protein TsaB